KIRCESLSRRREPQSPLLVHLAVHDAAPAVHHETAHEAAVPEIHCVPLGVREPYDDLDAFEVTARFDGPPASVRTELVGRKSMDGSGAAARVRAAPPGLTIPAPVLGLTLLTSNHGRRHPRSFACLASRLPLVHHRRGGDLLE